MIYRRDFLRCLSIRHPWCDLIVDKKRGVDLTVVDAQALDLEKYRAMGIAFLSVEVRKTNYRYRGPVAIRESTTVDSKACRRFSFLKEAEFPEKVIGWGTLVGTEPEVNDERWEQMRPYTLEWGPNTGLNTLCYIAEPQRIETPFATEGRLGLCRLNDDEMRRITDLNLIMRVDQLWDHERTKTWESPTSSAQMRLKW